MGRGYILIPDEIGERVDLTPAHKLVMGVLGRLQGDEGWCYPSYEYIAKASGISRRQVGRIVADLSRRKEITKLKHKRGEPNTYSVPWATSRALRKKWAKAKTVRAAS